jgi:hypothetical protein
MVIGIRTSPHQRSRVYGAGNLDDHDGDWKRWIAPSRGPVFGVRPCICASGSGAVRGGAARRAQVGEIEPHFPWG